MKEHEAMKDEQEMVYSESSNHKTLAGGIRSTIFYYDDHWNHADKKEATMCDIHEYDETGTLIQSTIGFLKKEEMTVIILWCGFESIWE